MKKITAMGVEERVCDMFSLPPGALLGTLCVYMSSNQEVIIENYKSIVECSENCIRLSYSDGNKRVKSKDIVINGKKLIIAYFTEQSLKIAGEIDSVMFASAK